MCKLGLKAFRLNYPFRKLQLTSFVQGSCLFMMISTIFTVNILREMVITHVGKIFCLGFGPDKDLLAFFLVGVMASYSNTVCVLFWSVSVVVHE